MKIANYKYVLGSSAWFIGGYSDPVTNTQMRLAFSEKYKSPLDWREVKFFTSFMVLEFQFEKEDPKPGMMVPDYTAYAEWVAGLMTVLYGKLVYPLGFTESDGSYRMPVFDSKNIRKKNAPFYSSEVRADNPIELNLVNLEQIESLHSFDPLLHNMFMFYLDALYFYETKPVIAYLNLISIGEMLTANMTFTDAELYSESKIQFFKEVSDISPALKKEINEIKYQLLQVKKKILSRSSKARFTRYLPKRNERADIWIAQPRQSRNCFKSCL